MATHSSVPAWRIPGMEEPGDLPSMGSHRAGHGWSNLAAAADVNSPPFWTILSYVQDCVYFQQDRRLSNNWNNIWYISSAHT